MAGMASTYTASLSLQVEEACEQIRSGSNIYEMCELGVDSDPTAVIQKIGALKALLGTAGDDPKVQNALDRLEEEKDKYGGTSDLQEQYKSEMVEKAGGASLLNAITIDGAERQPDLFKKLGIPPTESAQVIFKRIEQLRADCPPELLSKLQGIETFVATVIGNDPLTDPTRANLKSYFTKYQEFHAFIDSFDDSANPDKAYKVLGLAPGAGEVEIDAAYRKIVKLAHDLHWPLDDPTFKSIIQDSYDSLKDPTSRSRIEGECALLEDLKDCRSDLEALFDKNLKYAVKLYECLGLTREVDQVVGGKKYDAGSERFEATEAEINAAYKEILQKFERYDDLRERAKWAFEADRKDSDPGTAIYDKEFMDTVKEKRDLVHQAYSRLMNYDMKPDPTNPTDQNSFVLEKASSNYRNLYNEKNGYSTLTTEERAKAERDKMPKLARFMNWLMTPFRDKRIFPAIGSFIGPAIMGCLSGAAVAAATVGLFAFLGGPGLGIGLVLAPITGVYAGLSGLGLGYTASAKQMKAIISNDIDSAIRYLEQSWQEPKQMIATLKQTLDSFMDHTGVAKDNPELVQLIGTVNELFGIVLEMDEDEKRGRKLTKEEVLDRAEYEKLLYKKISDLRIFATSNPFKLFIDPKYGPRDLNVGIRLQMICQACITLGKHSEGWLSLDAAGQERIKQTVISQIRDMSFAARKDPVTNEVIPSLVDQIMRAKYPMMHFGAWIDENIFGTYNPVHMLLDFGERHS